MGGCDPSPFPTNVILQRGEPALNAAPAFRRPPTAQEAVLAELRRAILEGEMRPGTQILQDSVAESLGVSRVPVREALKILEGEGQVSYAPHRGYFVAELSYEELVEVYRIRELLEAEAMSEAIEKVTPEDIARMEEAIEDMERAGTVVDIVAMTAANRRFHFALIDPCERPRLIKFIRQLWDMTDPYRSVYFADASNRKLVNKEHREILEAAKSGRTRVCVEAMRRHRRNAVKRLQNLLLEP
jgi:DNA-binding GntR family transcriptional regulator